MGDLRRALRLLGRDRLVGGRSRHCAHRALLGPHLEGGEAGLDPRLLLKLEALFLLGLLQRRGETSPKSGERPPTRALLPHHGLAPVSLRERRFKAIGWSIRPRVTLGNCPSLTGPERVRVDRDEQSVLAHVTAIAATHQEGTQQRDPSHAPIELPLARPAKLNRGSYARHP